MGQISRRKAEMEKHLFSAMKRNLYLNFKSSFTLQDFMTCLGQLNEVRLLLEAKGI